MRDLTEYVEALPRCPDGHFWEYDPSDVQTRVENLADDDPPLYVWRAFTACPRCGFERPVEVRDATPEEVAAITPA